MYEVIKNYCENEKTNGLFLMDLPTGFGKTHNVIRFIFEESIKPENKDKKYFFITSLKKNLPVEKLRNLFVDKGLEEEFEKKFLYLNSNSELAINGFSKDNTLLQRAPKEIWEWEETRFFYQDLKDIVKQRNGKSNDFGDFTNSIENTFATNIEPDFRHKVESFLKNEIKNVDERRKAVLTNDRWKWLGDLYESTKTEQKQIIFLSAKKFVTKNSTIVDAPYLFYTNKIMDNSIVFIDEFDAVKGDFLDNIIDDGIREQVDFIDLFHDIHGILQTKNFQKDICRKSKWYEKRNYAEQPIESIFGGFKDRSDEIFEKFNLSYDLRTSRNDDVKRSFLFQDIQTHTITSDNKQIFVTYKPDKDLNEIQIGDASFENDSQNIQRMLSSIRGFIKFFQIGVQRLANNLYYYRSENNINDGEFTREAAISTVLKQFRLKDKHIRFLKNQILQNIRKTSDLEITKDFDLSFFIKGLRYYAFVNDVFNDLESVIMMFAFNNTPEKILLNVCERAKVIGISATATIPSVIGNFNLSYLKEQLGNNFQEMSTEDRERLRAEFYSKQKGYKKINIHAELLGEEVRNHCDEKSWMNIYNDPDVAREAYGIVNDAVPSNDNGFHKERYYRIIQAYKKFYENSNIYSFLCVLTTHPKDTAEASLRRSALIKLFSYIDSDAERKVEWLTTEDFESKKRKIANRLKNGEKCFVISAYATLGAGQNLQYEIPSNEEIKSTIVEINDSRDEDVKDFDGIYLDSPTHLLVNVNRRNLSQKDFVKFLFQIEYLLTAGEISPYLAIQHIRKGFDAFATQNYPFNSKAGKLSNCESVKLFATRNIIQAVGRMCRTNHKSKQIYIYADSIIADKIDDRVATNLILNHEFRELLNKLKMPQNDNIVKAKLELKAAYKSVAVNGFITSVLKEDWSEKNVKQWVFLRDFALRNPTASKNDIQKNGMSSFYAELPKKTNFLYFGQKRNYKDVEISFLPGNDACPSIESESECRLDRLMTRPEIREFFNQNNYATTFEANDYIMVPTMFNNIYKGAIGEVVGRFIFGLINIELEEITDLSAFEKFDFIVREKNVYVDFKHWSAGTDTERDEMIEKIITKAKDCSCNKVMVVNILDSRNTPSHLYNKDSVKILAIPSLLIDNGKEIRSNKEAVEKIRRFVGTTNDPV